MILDGRPSDETASKIQAIKLHRALTDSRLVEAKEEIERPRPHSIIKYPFTLKETAFLDADAFNRLGIRTKVIQTNKTTAKFFRKVWKEPLYT